MPETLYALCYSLIILKDFSSVTGMNV